MKIIFKEFPKSLLVILCIAVWIAFLDYSIYNHLNEIHIDFSPQILIYLAGIKFLFSILITYLYNRFAIAVELKLKSYVFDIELDGNSVNYFAFVSQNLAANYYTAIVRALSELSILLTFLLLIVISMGAKFKLTLILWGLLGCIVFLLYITASKMLRKTAAQAQNSMISEAQPLLNVKEQIVNNLGVAYAQKKIEQYSGRYRKFNTLALTVAQLPRSVLDVIVIVSIFFIVNDGMNIYSMSVLGLRVVTSFNNFINQIPLILHYRPYLQPLIKSKLER